MVVEFSFRVVETFSRCEVFLIDCEFVFFWGGVWEFRLTIYQQIIIL